MPISHEHRCIFVHSPKTAGTSIEKALGIFGDWRREDLHIMFGHTSPESQAGKELSSPFLQHLTATELAEILPEDQFLSYLKFAVVRNPWDRMVSVFCNKDPHLCQLSEARGIDLKNAGFDEFVTHAAVLDHAHLRPQVDYLHSKDGTPLIDIIAKWETLEPDFARICKRLGLDLALPRENASERRGYRDYYSKASRKLISTRYEADIENFGYTY